VGTKNMPISVLSARMVVGRRAGCGHSFHYS
jgi:hypothetical protein